MKIGRSSKDGRFLASAGWKRSRQGEGRRNLPREPDLTDPDNPEWTEEDFARARPAAELPVEVLKAFPKTRGRPRKEDAKVTISIRLDPDVIDAFKAGGPGWQTRINSELRKVVRRMKRAG